MDKSIQKAASLLGVDIDLMRDAQDISNIRNKRAEEQAAQQQQAMAMQAAAAGGGEGEEQPSMFSGLVDQFDEEAA